MSASRSGRTRNILPSGFTTPLKTSASAFWLSGSTNLSPVNMKFGGSSAPFVFKSLFTGFPVYRTYAAMNSYTGGNYEPAIKGDSVDSDKKGDLDADVYAKDLSEAVTYALSNGNLPRRTAVFPTQYPASGSQMEHIIKKDVNDAEAEEIFCRVVNLLKWNRQPLKRATILVLEQTIKEAFKIANSGRKGPVLIDIPKNVQVGECEYGIAVLPQMPEKPMLAYNREAVLEAIRAAR